jgi:hypothetical protein
MRPKAEVTTSRCRTRADLAVYEAPYDEAAGADGKWKRYKAEQTELLAVGRRGDAVLHHMKFVGIPDAVVAQMKASPAWADVEKMAPTLPYDVAVLGDACCRGWSPSGVG